MNLDLSQLSWQDCKSLTLEGLLIMSAIAESEQKRLSLAGICKSLDIPCVTRGPGSNGYLSIQHRCRSMWRDGLLLRFERRRLGRRTKRMQVQKFASAYWSLSDAGWLTLSRLRCYDPDKITKWMADDNPENP